MSGQASAGTSARYPWLDLIRGVAALEVVAGHLKSFMLDGIDKNSNLFVKIFNIVTGQAHNAVMIFFVLSGYLIGKQVFDRFGQNWSWISYAVRRLSRLWTVLVLALLMTVIWDYVGLHFLHGALYLGQLAGHRYGGSLPVGDMGSIHTTTTFFGNLFFLQNGILVGSFGVNGPLWSLANEFWYYVIFPLSFYAVSSIGRPLGRIICAAAAIGLCLLLPIYVVLYGGIWLFGVFVVVLEKHTPAHWRERYINLLTMGTAGCILALLLYICPRFLRNEDISDFIISGIFSILLFMLLNQDIKIPSLKRSGSFVAKFSYTLYLTHFPFLAILLCALSDNQKISLGFWSLLLCLLVFLITVLYAIAIYYIFERNTTKVQSYIEGQLLRRLLPLQLRIPAR
ncbi:MAG TPA: acyltransferase [Xanthobacteraceae bacterium]|nr:acyltransferase [Xanthobacteraceae bacterium]